MTLYIPCSLSDIPDGVRFSVSPVNQGQILEVAYGDFGATPAEAGDRYKRVTDRSLPAGKSTRYYAREDVAPKPSAKAPPEPPSWAARRIW